MNTSVAERDENSATVYNSYKELVVERRGERVLCVRINRPTVRNALNRRAYFELIRLLYTITYDPTVTIVVFTGTGTAFSSGNDLTESAEELRLISAKSQNEINENERLHENRKAVFIVRTLARSLIFCPKILIALVNGVSYGIGFTLAALCDIVYCTEDAYFGAPFARLGICPEMGSSFLLPYVLGNSKAMEILILGHKLSAEEALKCGFVARIFKKDQLEKDFWPKILQTSVLSAQSLKISKRLMTEPTREARLKAVTDEAEALKQLRFGPAHAKFVKNRKNTQSML